MTTSLNETSEQTSSRAWIGYVVPMALFMAITYFEASLAAQYVPVYILKVVLVTAALLYFRPVWKEDIRADARVLLPAIVVGMLVFAAWILIDPITPEIAMLGKRTEFNPFVKIPDANLRTLFLAFRFFGLVVMVPIMEELFWRSFLLRFITKEEFRSVPIGTYSIAGFGIVAAAFGFAHPEWLAAILCAAAYAGLLSYTKSIFACIIAHAVTNLALGIYVLSTGHWKFW